MLRATSRVILVNILFRFLIFFLAEYAFRSKYLSKNVQVVIQVVNNKKVMAKPRERQICMETGVSVKGQICSSQTSDSPRRSEARGQLDEVTRETVKHLPQELWTPNSGRSQFRDRHEAKPNRKFDSVRAQIYRNFRTVRPHFSVHFSISSLVIVRYRRIEPKFGLLNLSNCVCVCVCPRINFLITPRIGIKFLSFER